MDSSTAHQAHVEDTSTLILLREALDRLRQEQVAGGRNPSDRQRSLAITNLEQAILWLEAEKVLT